MSKGWDNATLKKLKALTGKGLSTAEIGKRLGLSKNAVVGKLNRLGWNLKATGTAPTATKTTTADKKSKSESAKKTVAKPVVAAKKAKENKTVTVKKTIAPKAAEKKTPVKTKVKDTKVSEEKTDKKSLDKDLAMHQRIIQHSLEMASLKPNQCRWPIGDPDSENFHFCGETVFVGKPYCYEHCKQAYQFTPPKKK